MRRGRSIRYRRLHAMPVTSPPSPSRVLRTDSGCSPRPLHASLARCAEPRGAWAHNPGHLERHRMFPSTSLALRGKTALVTGVSRRRGIGFAVATQFARLGADVFIHHYRPHDIDLPWGGDDLDAVRDGLRE